jgi:acetyltransferase-like isoleucine patch superfamily enzyme
LFFNFYYLPIKQAIKLPICLYKPKLLKMSGKVKIESEDIKPGMIKLGIHMAFLYPDTGILWENCGGEVVFKGKTIIGNATAISIGPQGKLSFGHNFRGNAGLKIACYCQINISEHVGIGWESLIIDTSFHKLKHLDGSQKGTTLSPVFIGKNNWFGTRCIVLKGTKTPDHCIVGAASLLNKDYSNYPTHILLSGHPVEIKGKGIWRDLEDDKMF